MTGNQDYEQGKEETAEVLAQYMRERNLAGENGKASMADAAAAFERQARRR